MRTYKKILLGVVFAFSLVISSCSDESELIVPQVDTTDTIGAEGTGGKDVDRD